MNSEIFFVISYSIENRSKTITLSRIDIESVVGNLVFPLPEKSCSRILSRKLQKVSEKWKVFTVGSVADQCSFQMFKFLRRRFSRNLESRFLQKLCFDCKEQLSHVFNNYFYGCNRILTIDIIQHVEKQFLPENLFPK